MGKLLAEMIKFKTNILLLLVCLPNSFSHCIAYSSAQSVAVEHHYYVLMCFRKSLSFVLSKQTIPHSRVVHVHAFMFHIFVGMHHQGVLRVFLIHIRMLKNWIDFGIINQPNVFNFLNLFFFNFFVCSINSITDLFCIISIIIFTFSVHKSIENIFGRKAFIILSPYSKTENN